MTAVSHPHLSWFGPASPFIQGGLVYDSMAFTGSGEEGAAATAVEALSICGYTRGFGLGIDG